MKDIYTRIWELAKPFYEKGRPMDIDHIEWMMQDALFVCKEEGIDDSLLLPLVILHDVGYSTAPKGDPYDPKLRRAHMLEGSEIGRFILGKVNYSKAKLETIVQYISVHDNWAFGELEIYNNDLVLGTFKDLDFAWMATPKGFSAMMKILNKKPDEMLKYLIAEKGPIGGKKPFSTDTAKQLYDRYLNDRRIEVQSLGILKQ